ncbi:hypothetical protein [Streptomyces sp. NPDC005004]
MTDFRTTAVARTPPEPYTRRLTELRDPYRQGTLRPGVFARIPLADASEAHRIIESRRTSARWSLSREPGQPTGVPASR